MAQVHGNPKDMLRFAVQLKQFTNDLQVATQRINSASHTVSSSWNDNEYRKFRQDWEKTLTELRRFISDAPRYEQHVRAKAQALEAYLNQNRL